jgi:DNA-binding transcriptional ArsR family regulator
MPAGPEPDAAMPTPRLIWDLGTGYDLFVSLTVLHEPSKYGLRGPWAQGVLKRLAPADREMVQETTGLVGPIGWVHTLPEPKNSETVLRALAQLAPEERLPRMFLSSKIPPEVVSTLEGVAARGSWSEADRTVLSRAHCALSPTAPTKELFTKILTWWSCPEEFGVRYLEALRGYYEVFFAEEEGRIRPALEQALARAQALAERLALPAMLEELSQGLRLAELPAVPELVLAPSFWSTPLVVFAAVSAERELMLFGARPPDASLVPGEVIPDTLMRALEALGHPTRLRILRYLSREALRPAQLARRLRLRAPTVIHHLDALRMAELVQLTLEAGDERRYTARPAAIRATFCGLESFLRADDVADSPDRTSIES